MEGYAPPPSLPYILGKKVKGHLYMYVTCISLTGSFENVIFLTIKAVGLSDE